MVDVEILLNVIYGGEQDTKRVRYLLRWLMPVNLCRASDIRSESDWPDNIGGKIVSGMMSGRNVQLRVNRGV